MVALCFLRAFKKNRYNAGQHVTSPMINFTHAKDTPLHHGSQQSHITVTEDATTVVVNE